MAVFEKSNNQVFVEYSTGVEISTMKFSEKKLMMFLDIHHKYLGLIFITYEDIKKVKWDIFFGLTVRLEHADVSLPVKGKHQGITLRIESIDLILCLRIVTSRKRRQKNVL